MKTVATKRMGLAPWFCSLLLMCCGSNAWAATFCYSYGATLVMNFTVPSTLTIPKNAPNGTVIYNSPQKSPTGAPTFKCDVPGSWGYTNARGSTASDTDPSPIGDTGLGWRLSYGKTYAPAYPEGSLNAASYTFVNSVGFTLYKIGEIKSGAIDSGQLGNLVGFGLNIIQLNLANSITFTEVSCQTPSVNIDLGKQYSSKFGGIGSTIGQKAFNIALNDCPSGLSSISYRLDPVNPAFDAKQGVLALDAGGATGVGIQITDSNNAVVTLGEAHRFLDTSPSGNYLIPLQAAYYKTADKIEPGKANAALQFTITYQ
ncbi:fimbrial protein [Pseudomonas sp. UBA4194]|uniref:fimbrial protein n=1 Tax=Pseudomonas sp. UBA4194 TaxID=1947317 RepID=UPI0025F7B1DA|nr:fimbrial protein [Pseudomonas sp. UBA4194]